jgi:TonB family protein
MGLPLPLPPDGKNSTDSVPSHVPSELRIAAPEVLPPDTDVYSLTRTLADHGAGEFSPEVALDLVLHEIAEHIRQATSADSAALALRDGDEMVCRAAAGASAPDLGTRIDARSGLSGLCLQTGEWQYCQDCETDPRVDVDACRRLGARSFLVMPVIDEVGPFGVIQVSSATANAFSQKDVETLRQSGRSIVWARRQVMQSTLLAETPNLGELTPPEQVGGEVRPDLETDPKFEIEPHSPASLVRASREGARQPGATAIDVTDNTDSARNGVSPADAEASRDLIGTPLLYAYSRAASVQKDKQPSRRYDEIFTAILGFLVVAAALLLGMLVGTRFGWQKAVHLPIAGKSASTTTIAGEGGGNTIPATNNQLSASGSIAPENATQAATPTYPAHGLQEPLRRALPARAEPVGNERVGSLVVYQRDKIVFQQSGGEANNTPDLAGHSAVPAQTITLTPDAAAARLLHRVDPESPAAAVRRGILGPVQLQALINDRGEVTSLGLIEGDPALAAAAIKAVRQWRYQPYLVNGAAVSVQTQITVNFHASPR